jgi:hypothetical protein
MFNDIYSEMTNYHSICSDIDFIKMCTNYYKATYYFKFAPTTACIDTIFNWKTYILLHGFEINSMWHLYLKQ